MCYTHKNHFLTVLKNSKSEFGFSNVCRNCLHVHWATDDRPSFVHKYLIHRNFTIYKCVNDNCECENFAPKDNLEYLEWCYEKNGVTKRKEKKSVSKNINKNFRGI